VLIVTGRQDIQLWLVASETSYDGLFRDHVACDDADFLGGIALRAEFATWYIGYYLQHDIISPDYHE
jgi:hypothetical protein